MRLKGEQGIIVFGHQMMLDVQKFDKFAAFIASGDEIQRVERHQLRMLIEPQSDVVCYRVWTRNAFEEF